MSVLITAFIYMYLSCFKLGERHPLPITQGSYDSVRETGTVLAKASKSFSNTCLFSKQIAVINDLFKK